MDNNLENIEFNKRLFFKTLYLSMYQEGYHIISLNDEVLDKYVPKLDLILQSYNIDCSKLLSKTYGTDNYDNYKLFLVELFVDKIVGNLNIKTRNIDLNCRDYYIDKLKNAVIEYQDILYDCKEAIETALNNDLKLTLNKN